MSCHAYAERWLELPSDLSFRIGKHIPITVITKKRRSQEMRDAFEIGRECAGYRDGRPTPPGPPRSRHLHAVSSA